MGFSGGMSIPTDAWGKTYHCEFSQLPASTAGNRAGSEVESPNGMALVLRAAHICEGSFSLAMLGMGIVFAKVERRRAGSWVGCGSALLKISTAIPWTFEAAWCPYRLSSIRSPNDSSVG